MAFMFETCYMLKISQYANKEENMDMTYLGDSWGGMKKHFNA